MQLFDAGTFRRFVGQAVCRVDHPWGVEERYVVSAASLDQYGSVLKDTVYHHHSSFDICDEIAELGYPLTAQAMRLCNSGNPTDPKTQMGNLGEVMGAEFARAFLGFETTYTFPKRFNTNVDQSMPGADIIGLRDSARNAQLLFGEAKARGTFDKRSVEEAYDQLVALSTRGASQYLHCLKETARLKQDKHALALVDRHIAPGVPRCHLILVVTGSAATDPFGVLAPKYAGHQVPALVAVYIQIRDLQRRKQSDREDWLSWLFRP